jgi:hypothetical protein
MPRGRSVEVQDEEVRVPLTEIAEQGTEVRHAVEAADELGVRVCPDWAERPSVPLASAGKVLSRAVELRDIEAKRRLAAIEEHFAALERAHSPLRGIPAPPGAMANGASAYEVMRKFDEDR